jgi:hypothetical protein
MSFPPESTLVILIGGAVLIFAVYLVLDTWFVAWEQQVPSPLERALYRVGADPVRLAARRVAVEIARAQERCASCPATGACREWLESGTPDTYRSFCPNAALIDRLRR